MSKLSPKTRRILTSAIIALGLNGVIASQSVSQGTGNTPRIDADELAHIYSAQIPKRETGVDQFLQQYPTYDGRDVVIAIFDTGVDPEAPGMQFTTTGERKLVDIIDASGAGDVNMTTVISPDENRTLTGLTGRTLQLPAEIENPTGDFRIGVKYGKELFHEGVWKRVMDYRNAQNQSYAHQKRIEFIREKTLSDENKTSKEKAEKVETEFEHYLKSIQSMDKGPIYDCILWKDETHWNAIVDTDEDGDLTDETILRPFGTNGEWASFPDYVSMNFGVQVYEQGDLLSIVTTSGSHGTHVASIAAAHFPNNPNKNGVAPGAKILSVRLGDVRIGGSSSYIGEYLATAIAAKYKVDIMNASWGGQPIYQNGSSFGVKLYNELVEKYGVTAFVSAGNDGPALSTVGSPGGIASNVIGVGAYVSPEMGTLLYSVVGNTPATTYMFTARGPARNGDMGVDILAPGAAIASLAKDSLRSSDLYNGTSMASPSAAGVGALLISAAKQENLHYSPARIRYALMNTAKPLPEETIFSQGTGLIHTEAAWKHLKQYQNEPALDLFYDVTVSGGSYGEGPGQYLRADDSEFIGTKSSLIRINPIFPDALDNRTHYDLNLVLGIKSDSSWIHCPDVLHLSNSGNSFRPELELETDANEISEGLRQGNVSLYLADNDAIGPLIRIPFTHIRSKSDNDNPGYLGEQSFELTESTSFRRFVTPPQGATQLSLTMKRSTEEGVQKLFLLHALTLLSNQEIETVESKQYFRLDSGESKTFTIPVIEGKPLELTVHQVWSYDELTQLSYEGKWNSFTSNSAHWVMSNSDVPATIEVQSSFDSSFDIEAELNQAVFKIDPTKTNILAMDERSMQPKGTRDAIETEGLRVLQTFEFDTLKPVKIAFESTEFSTHFDTGGGIIEVYDQNGLLVASDIAPTDPDELRELPQGKLTAIREFVSPTLSNLERLKDLPLILSANIDAKNIELFNSKLDYAKNRSSSSLSLSKHQQTTLVAKTDKHPEVSAFKINPIYFRGHLKVKQEDDEQASIELRSYPTSSNVSDEAPIKETETTVDASQNLAKAIYDIQLDFLQTTRSSKNTSIKEQRKSLLKQLLKTSKDPNLWLEEIYEIAVINHLIHPWMYSDNNALSTIPDSVSANNDALNDLLKKIEKTFRKCKPDKVAQYFGLNPKTEFPDTPEGQLAKQQHKGFEEIRSLMATLQLIAADAYMLDGKPDLAKTALEQYNRWKQSETSPDPLLSQLINCRWFLDQNKPASALEVIRTAQEIHPDHKLLKQWQEEAYEALNWILHQKHETLYHKLSQHPEKLR